MATVSSLGTGSGLDLSGLLTSLMQAEQQPLVALQQKEISYQARISALGTMKSALASMQSSAAGLIPSSGQSLSSKYAAFSASVADSTIATATATTAAIPGSYSLEVSKLAQAQRLATATPGSPAASPYATADSAISHGKLSFEIGTLDGSTFVADGSRPFSITIDDSNDTLAGLRDAINSANKGVSATIVTGTAGAQLVLTSAGTGLQNVMKLTGSDGMTGFDFDPTNPTAGGMTQEASQGGQAAQNAEFKLNGISGTSSTNKVTDLLDGVTLTLAKTNVGTPTTLTVSKDTSSSLTSSLSGFVKTFNDAISTMSSLGAYDAKTKAAGALQGDSVLRSAQFQLRNMVFGTVAGGSSAYQRLSDIGISFAKDGTLSLDSSKLTAAISKDFEGVANLAKVVGEAFNKGVEGMTGTSGTVTSAVESTNSLIKSLSTQRTSLNKRLEDIEARYRAQFTALDTLIAGMKQTSTYLTQQLASLPKSGS